MKNKNVVKVILFLTLILSSCKTSEDLNSSNNTVIPDENLDSGYTATCLQSKADDTKSFGSNLAVSDSYLAASDYKANKVVIYTRSSNDTWQRKHEIHPPESSLAKKLGYGFGSSLAMNNGTLIIKSIGHKRKLTNKETQRLAELYFVSLSNQEGNLIPKKIGYPKPGKTSITSLTFLEKNIAFAARTRSDDGKGVNRVYIANPISGEVVNSIESPEMQYPHREFDTGNGFLVDLGVHKNSLIIGNLYSPWTKSIFRLYSDGKLEKVIFDYEHVNEERTKQIISEYAFLTLAISNELAAISSWEAGEQNTIIFRGFPKISEFKTIYSSGVLDAYKSHVLISHRTAPGIMPIYKGDPDHTLVGLENNKITVKSDITWEREQYNLNHPESSFIDPIGVIGERELFLAARGKVIYLPIKNLPKNYEIKLSTCGE